MAGGSVSICCLSFKSSIFYAECTHNNNGLKSLDNLYLQDSKIDL